VTLLTEKIKRHRLNSNESQDETVYEENDKSNYIGVVKSKSEKYIFIYTGGTLSSETRFIKASEPDATFKVFQPRIKEVLYEVTALDDKFLIVTNWKAKNFRLMECPLDKTDSTQWKEVIPHREDVLLSGIEEFKNFLVISERKNGLVQLRIKDLKNNNESYLNFDEPAYTAYVGPTGNIIQLSFATIILLLPLRPLSSIIIWLRNRKS
jgi:oligopeptidase B